MKKVIAFTALAALVALVGPFTADAAVIGNLTLGSGTVNQGSSLSISGACGSAAANSTVNIVLSNGTTTQTTSVTANASGDFSTNLALSATFPIGTTSVVATCPNGDTVTGQVAVNAPIGSTLTLSGNPTLGQNVTISGSCGTTAVGGNVSVNLVRSGGVVTNLGTTTTTTPSGSFSATFAIPSNYGGGPVTVSATCPNGTITFNTSVVDPLANIVLGSTTPGIGTSLTVSGMCSISAGVPVTFILSAAGRADIELGTTNTGANGSFSTILTIPSGYATGPAMIVASCPTGNIATAGLTVTQAPVINPPVVFPPVTDPGTDTGAVGGVGTTPVGGVAAGRTNTNLMTILGLALMVVGLAGFAGSKKIADSLNDSQ